METNAKSMNIANGTVHYPERTVILSEKEWKQHPEFSGVYLKHLITGQDTGGVFSSHLVKIDPHCILDTHCHADRMELHEVLEGKGECRLMDQSFVYHFGKSALIPKEVMHSVHAGERGLTLIAKFFPALI